jgi:hypothetical protein
VEVASRWASDIGEAVCPGVEGVMKQARNFQRNGCQVLVPKRTAKHWNLL